MKKILIIIFVFKSLFLYSQEKILSLSECIDLAIENNENLKNSKLEEKISKSLSKEYLSIGFPQINFDGGLKYNHDVPKSLISVDLCPVCLREQSKKCSLAKLMMEEQIYL